MANEIRTLRAVLNPSQAEFGRMMGAVLSPSQPLQSTEFLRGRNEQIEGIKKALYQTGRHVLIHGLRGVGKSSLAQTAAFLVSEKSDPIIVGCDRYSTLHSVIKDIFDEFESRDPRLREKVVEAGGGFSFNFFAADARTSSTTEATKQPTSLNEAVRLLGFLSSLITGKLIVVVDEFDLIEDRSQQVQFTNLVKQISDKHVPVCLIICGIGESPTQLMEAHGSADRYFHTVELGTLAWEARFEIVSDAADRLGITVDRDTNIRIAKISDGFPHYVHFISEKLFWQVYEANNDGQVTPHLFELAMNDAAASMDIRLKGPYEKATQKYNDDYEAVLWAVADGHEFVRRSTSIYKESYLRISQRQGFSPLDRSKFNQRMNNLKKESHGSILSGSRQGWYEFTEKMIRGYVRLRAEQKGVELASDHPVAPSFREKKTNH